MELLRCWGCFEECRWMLAVSWMKGINFNFFCLTDKKLSRLNYQIIHLSNFHSMRILLTVLVVIILSWLAVVPCTSEILQPCKMNPVYSKTKGIFGLATWGLLLARSSASNNPIKPMTFDEAKMAQNRTSAACSIKCVKHYLLKGAISLCTQP